MWGELFHERNFDNAHKFLNCVWDECHRVLKDGCKLIINIANTKRSPYLANTAKIYQWAWEAGIEPKGEIIWNKGYGQGGTAWGSFRSPSDPSLADQHEYILVFRKRGDRHRPESFDKIDMHDFTSWRNSIWSIAPARASKIGHCAPFPVQIPKRLITLYSFKDELVLDPFCGAGTAGMACARLGRRFIGIDTVRKYLALARTRINRELMQPNLPF